MVAAAWRFTRWNGGEVGWSRRDVVVPASSHALIPCTQKKNERGHPSVRGDMGNRIDGVLCSGEAHLAGKRRKSAAEQWAPASNLNGLGARFLEEGKGNERGARGLFIGKKKESNPCFNRRNRAAAFSAETEARSSLEEGDGVTSSRRHIRLTGGSHLAVSAEKKWKGALAAVYAGFCWASAVRARAGGKGRAGPARALLARAGLSNSFFVLFFSVLKTAIAV